MIHVSDRGTVIKSKLVGTSDTKIQFNLFELAVLPEKVDKTSFEIDLNTLQCTIEHWDVKMNIGRIQSKYFEHIIAKKVKLINFKVTGLDKDGNLKYRNVGINVELELSN